MTIKRAAGARKKAAPLPKERIGQATCFVISPIGQVGTERHGKFKEVLDYVIKAGVKASGYDLQVLRADDIDRAGSFIKDILDSLYNSYVVIADLTEQNPNVFYELGVRHALSPRTILIAQSVDDIPSDLREYRTIVYDTSAKGAAEFAARLKKFLAEMQTEPERADNPVLDRIGSIFENRVAALEAEKQQLKNDLAAVLQGGQPKEKSLYTLPLILVLIGLQNSSAPNLSFLVAPSSGVKRATDCHTNRANSASTSFKRDRTLRSFGIWHHIRATSTIKTIWPMCAC